MHPLTQHATAAVAFHLTQDPISGNVAPAMGKGNGEGCATIGVYQGHGSNVGPLGALRKGNGNTAGGVPFTAAPAGVRRLTPVECERLMGWPDGWTAPEGVKAPDSRRYAACGDGVASPVAEWIGHRLAQALRTEASP